MMLLRRICRNCCMLRINSLLKKIRKQRERVIPSSCISCISYTDNKIVDQGKFPSACHHSFCAPFSWFCPLHPLFMKGNNHMLTSEQFSVCFLLLKFQHWNDHALCITCPFESKMTVLPIKLKIFWVSSRLFQVFIPLINSKTTYLFKIKPFCILGYY